jgi:hypothetical protein
MAKKGEKSPQPPATPAPKPLACGLIMPLSAIDGCTADHWAEVKAVVTDAIECIAEPRFSVRLVSDADETGVIQKRIVQNLYGAEIVVCDVSGKNPNVMFELGLRLAFDKPAVIVKDDKTDYSFDTGIIEHVPYPRDLRFGKVVDFKKALADKVLGTYRASIADPGHSPFLKNFGKFQVAALTQTEVPPDKIVVALLTELQSDVEGLRRRIDMSTMRRRGVVDSRGIGVLGRIVTAVSEFRQKEKIDNLSELIDNEELYKFVERTVDAPAYFEDRDTFLETVKTIVKGTLLTRGGLATG